MVYFAFASIFSSVLASIFLRGAPAFDSIPPTRKFSLQAAAPERVPSAEDVLRGDLQALCQVHRFLRTFRLLESADGFAPGEITVFRQLQRITGRPETGVYDESIVSISRPHCGTAPPASSSVQKRWASEAKWRHNNIMYRYRNFTSDLPPGAQKLSSQRSDSGLPLHPQRC